MIARDPYPARPVATAASGWQSQEVLMRFGHDHFESSVFSFREKFLPAMSFMPKPSGSPRQCLVLTVPGYYPGTPAAELDCQRSLYGRASHMPTA